MENAMKHNRSVSIRTLLWTSACLLLIPTASLAADDGAALYKKRCAGCHGATGEGKASMKAPALKTTKLDANQIAQHLAKGEPGSKPPHNKAMSGLTTEQAAAIAQHVKSL
jgi:cytochrome c553